MSKKFTHLHAHTEASIADGLFHPKKWVQALKDKGFTSHAVTDHGTMASLLPFHKLMKAEKMTPLLGCEFYFTDDPTVKTAANRKASHLILIAKNYDGFRNMMKLSKLSYTDGYYYKPKIGLEWLKEHSEGLVCLSACQGGVLSNEVWRESRGEKHFGLENRFKQFVDIFGKDFYVEFQGHNTINHDPKTLEEYDSQALINKELYRLRTQPGFQGIVTNDCHYILQEHAPIQKVLKDISWGKADSAESSTVTEDHGCDSLWLKKARQVYDAFDEHHGYLPGEFVKDGIYRTTEVLEKCEGLEFPKNRHYLPKFRPEIDSKELFRKLTLKKLKDFLAEPANLRVDREEYIARFKKEFKVIKKYDLEDYFLIVWDLIRFADKKGIYTGLGRGSAAGCLISYLLGIVQIDPLEYKLLFERFLNENRCETGEMPDIDLDFESERRGEIKEYIYKTYGHDKVCEIGTYGRMKLKTSMIDFAKATGAATHKEILEMTTKLDLDKEDVLSIDAAMEFDPRIDQLMKANPELKFMVEEISGQIKTQGVHPAGVLICSEPVADITPVKTQKNNKEKDGTRIVATQSEDKYVIAQGLMKVDVLGLKEYDVIHYVLDHAKTPFTRENYRRDIMNAEREKPNDAVWKLFQEGRTEAVFQFASTGMQELLVNMQPERVNDLIAANALYRPGCLENGWDKDYCNRKRGDEEVEFPHEDVEAGLGETYGVIVYQEQFMEVIHRLGGIDLVDADTIRSALGKKDKDKLGKFKAQFVTNAAKKIGKDEALELWDQIEKASGYTFNKSHSAAYSVLAYISQFLKVNYPAHFWAAQLHWDVNKNKTEDLITDRRAAMAMGVKYVLPDVNASRIEFYVNPKEEIVWSIRSIGGVGPGAAAEIINKREKDGPYTDFKDFYLRVNKSSVKFNIIERMIYAGVFDSIGDRRECLRQLYDYANAKKGAKTKRTYKTPTEESLMRGFHESVGFFERCIKDMKGSFSDDVVTETELRKAHENERVTIGGMVTDIRVIMTKKKEPMAFVTIMDMDEMIEVTVFPTQFARFRPVLKKDSILEIAGKKNTWGDKQNVIVMDFAEAK